jgi:predicted HD superfamily hydrolase involved in NAD metabolism
VGAEVAAKSSHLMWRGISEPMDYILEYIEKKYSASRKRHTFDVCATAKSLARFYGADEEKAEIAALFHDMFKDITSEELRSYAKNLNIKEEYYDNINLAHSKIAAAIMESDYNISDEDILNAVKFHTTGRAGMSLLEKVIFLADLIEPGRDYPGVEKIRNLAYKDLNKACLAAMENTLDYVTKKGENFDEDTLNAMEYLKLNKT